MNAYCLVVLEWLLYIFFSNYFVSKVFQNKRQFIFVIFLLVIITYVDLIKRNLQLFICDTLLILRL